jgi:hypothetical protein
MEVIYYTMVAAVPSLGVALLVADHGSVMAPRTNARPPEAIRSNWLADIFYSAERRASGECGQR